jgi:hypothetical protein
MTLHGTAKVSESSPSGTAKKSQSNLGKIRLYQLNRSVETRFGHAFLMDTGSSTGEILGHSKVSHSIFRQ